jgi:hypothetical protein
MIFISFLFRQKKRKKSLFKNKKAPPKGEALIS